MDMILFKRMLAQALHDAGSEMEMDDASLFDVLANAMRRSAEKDAARPPGPTFVEIHHKTTFE